MIRSRFVPLVALLAGLTAPAMAQVQRHQYEVSARVGTMNFDQSAAIKNGSVVGVDGTYYFTSHVGLGWYLDATRAVTDGSFFPAEFTFGDTLFLYEVSQPITVLHYGLQAVVTAGYRRISPYVAVGGGWYRFFLDPQVANGPKSFTKPMFALAGGLNMRLGAATGLRMEVRDAIHTDFDRDRLNPVGSRFQPVRFPHVLGPTVAEKGTTHNVQLSIAFSFAPGRGQ